MLAVLCFALLTQCSGSTITIVPGVAEMAELDLLRGFCRLAQQQYSPCGRQYGTSYPIPFQGTASSQTAAHTWSPAPCIPCCCGWHPEAVHDGVADPARQAVMSPQTSSSTDPRVMAPCGETLLRCSELASISWYMCSRIVLQSSLLAMTQDMTPGCCVAGWRTSAKAPYIAGS